MITNTLLFGMPGTGEWVIILLAIILLFGAKKIPELARGIGQGIREFKDAKNDISREIQKEAKDLKKED